MTVPTNEEQEEDEDDVAVENNFPESSVDAIRAQKRLVLELDAVWMKTKPIV